MRLFLGMGGWKAGLRGERDLATGRPFLYRFLHAESRLFGGASISLVGGKNVAQLITER
jgi:hypothetical protein